MFWLMVEVFAAFLAVPALVPRSGGFYNRGMTLQLRAHFDGRVLVPEEPLDLPVDQTLTLRIEVPAHVRDDTLAKLAALDRIAARAVSANLPAEALARESIYEDRP